MLETIKSPDDIKNYNSDESAELADEIRNVILSTVSKNGGHLASNLGIVELTIALHQVFNSPNDKIIFDVGHQCYPHKLLTGRYELFNSLRQMNGISGFTNRFESQHDFASEGHCGTSISVALGIAESNRILGNSNYAVAVVGDGALTNGMIYEALNNATNREVNLIVVINDNEMSISQNVGGLHRYLSEIRTSKRYFKFKKSLESFLLKVPCIGKWLAKGCKNTKDFFKKVFMKNNIFEDLGFVYLGPVDGHNIERTKFVLEEAKSKNSCCIVHVLTKKGKGYVKAEEVPEKYHSVGSFNINDGVRNSQNTTYSDFVGNLLCQNARNNPHICAITAAMCDGTGLAQFSQEFPSRFFDVGIAEEHAITFASGLSLNGMIPVVFLYSTFVQRSYDQLLHDIAIQKTPLVLMLDRAGVVPNDGITHQGIFDYSMISNIPNVQIYAPENFSELKNTFEYVIRKKEFSVIRYPKGYENDYLKSYNMNYSTDRNIQFTEACEKAEVVILTYGRTTKIASQIVSDHKNIFFGIIKLIKIFPLKASEICPLIKSAKAVVIIDEGIKAGGVAEKITAMLHKQTNATILTYSINGFIEHGGVDELINTYAFSKKQIRDDICASIL